MVKTKYKRRRIILIALLLIGVVLAIWYFTRPKAVAPKVASTQTKSAASTTDTKKSDTTIDKDAPAKTEPSSTTSNNLYIMVNRPVNNDTLKMADGIQFRSTISGANSGSCSLTAVGPSNKTVTKSGAMVTQTSYGSCNFDIASSEVVAGDWTLTLTATAASTTSKATIRVAVQ